MIITLFLLVEENVFSLSFNDKIYFICIWWILYSFCASIVIILFYLLLWMKLCNQLSSRYYHQVSIFIQPVCIREKKKVFFCEIYIVLWIWPLSTCAAALLNSDNSEHFSEITQNRICIKKNKKTTALSICNQPQVNMLPLSVLAERIPFLSSDSPQCPPHSLCWSTLSPRLHSLPAQSPSFPSMCPWHLDCANSRPLWANSVWLRLWSALLLPSCCARHRHAALPPPGLDLHWRTWASCTGAAAQHWFREIYKHT